MKPSVAKTAIGAFRIGFRQIILNIDVVLFHELAFHSGNLSGLSERHSKLKVKVTLVQALRLCTGRTAHRGSRGIALPFHDHGTGRE